MATATCVPVGKQQPVTNGERRNFELDNSIFFAIMYNKTGFLEKLVRCGGDSVINRQLKHCPKGMEAPTPLHIASYFVRPNIISLLCDLGADIHRLNAYGYSAIWELFDACPKYDIDPSRKRVNQPPNMSAHHDFDLDLELSNWDCQDKDMFRGDQEDFVDAFSLLSSMGCNPNGSVGRRDCMIIEALKRRNMFLIKTLLNNRYVSVDCRDSESRTPLILLSSLVYAETKASLVELLVCKNVSLSARDKDGLTALHHVTRSGHCNVPTRDDVEVASILLKAGAPPNLMDCKGNTPLHNAVVAGKFDLVNNLLEYGARAFARNKRGETPIFLGLDIADLQILAARLDIVESLVRHTPYFFPIANNACLPAGLKVPACKALFNEELVKADPGQPNTLVALAAMTLRPMFLPGLPFKRGGRSFKPETRDLMNRENLGLRPFLEYLTIEGVERLAGAKRERQLANACRIKAIT